MARVTCDTCVIAAIELWVSASCSLLLTKRSSWNVMHTRCFTFVYLNFVSVFFKKKEKGEVKTVQRSKKKLFNEKH